MIHYLVQIVAFQLLFLIVYDFFLKGETFFNWNRVYLLGTAVLSILLPFIKIESFKNVVPEEYTFSFSQLAFETQNPVVLNEVVLQGANTSNSNLSHVINILLLGCILALFYFLFRIFQILKLAYTNPKVKEKDFSIVQVSNSSVAFSFFNYVFLGEKIKTHERESILKHELVHIEQKHTWDLLFFEALRVVFWFNPLVYMYQNRISDLHEFIADSKAVKHNKKQYYENLLSQVFDTKWVSFINPFFKQSLIKKRIIMLQKSKSKQIKLVRYILLIPIIAVMLIYSSCSEEQTTQEIVEHEKTITDKIEDIKISMEENGGLNKEEQDALSKLLMQAKKANGYQINEDNSSLNEVPFAVIDQVPVFPGCETENSNKERKACMNKRINEFLIKNFNTNIAKQSGLSGVQQVRVFFKIGSDGKIKDIKVRAPHPDLKNEALRVIKMLPTMIPGEHGGKKVSVPYYLPIKFQVKE